jgi:hypothetical protein
LDRNFSTTILVHVLFPVIASCVAKLDSIASICSSVMLWAGLGTGRCSRCDLDAHVSEALGDRPYTDRGDEGSGTCGGPPPPPADPAASFVFLSPVLLYGSIMLLVSFYSFKFLVRVLFQRYEQKATRAAGCVPNKAEAGRGGPRTTKGQHYRIAMVFRVVVTCRIRNK